MFDFLINPFLPMIPFDPPEKKVKMKYKRFSNVFRGIKMGTFGRKGLRILCMPPNYVDILF